jgi:K+-transporting ATPase KdpF subunit
VQVSREAVPEREWLMTVDYLIGLIVTAGLLVYLTYALLRPEKF